MSRKHIFVACLTLTLLSVGACDEDTIGGYGLDAGPDGSMNPDGSPGADADGSDGPDGSDGGDNGSELPGAGNEAPVFAEQPASNAFCNAYDWCWVHPSPFPYRVNDLQAVGERVFGVTFARQVGGRAGVIWKGESMELVRLDVPDDAELQDITTSKDGWLAITPEGTVFDIGPDGLRESLTVEEDELRSIFGNSIDNFVVRAPEERGVVMRDGKTTVLDNLPGDSSSLMMGEDGRVWGLTDENSVQTAFDGDWRLFPRPQVEGSDADLSAFGPSPGRSCTPDSPWLADSNDAIFRWNNTSSEWVNTGGEDNRVQGFGCDTDGNVIAVDRIGRMGTFADGEWSYTQVTQRELNDSAIAGSTLHLAGIEANHAIIRNGRTTRLASGFFVPAEEVYFSGYELSADIWVDAQEQQVALMYTSGVYLGSEPEGWDKMWGPPYAEDGGDRGELDISQTRGASEVWGLDEPKFALTQEHVLEWVGSAWIDITTSEVEAFGIFETTDIVGSSEDDVWILLDYQVFHYDGESWTHLTESGTQLRETLRGNRPSSIHISADGQVLLARDGSFEQLQQGNTGWELVEVQSTPCEDDILNRYRDEDGTLWVAGRASCAASLTDGEWTNYTFPLDPDTITYTDRSRTWVEQPGDGPPLLVAYHGIYEPQPDGTMEVQFRGQMMDAVYIESSNATYAVHQDGVLAKFGND